MDFRASSDDPCERVVIITGAGSGLGRAVAQRLLRDGFQCVLAGPYDDALSQTLATSGHAGDRGSIVVCDIRVPEDRARLVSLALEQPGSLFGLVNNAGIARGAPLLDETLEDWRDTFETNLEAAFFLAQHVLGHMRHRREGRIVNIASVYGMIGLNNAGLGARAPQTTTGGRGPLRQSAYASSKGGLIQLTRDLAAAVGCWGITVNAVSPGWVPHPQYNPEERRIAQDRLRRHDRDDSSVAAGRPFPRGPGLGEAIDSDVRHALAAQVPLGRLGTVDEIAGPVRFLLSEDAAYITGANLVVDGGFSVW